MWLSSLKENNIKDCIYYAQRLIENKKINPPLKSYVYLFQNIGFKPNIFFSNRFNGYDYDLWRSALFFSEIASNIKENDVTNILEVVTNKIVTKKNNSKHLLWPVNIWSDGSGLCDRSAWVFCEIAFQLGWDTRIIYLYKPNMDVSNHTICEISKDGKSYVVDTTINNYIMGNFEELKDNGLKTESLWPNNSENYKMLENALSFIPSFPQDYYSKNQILFDVLKEEFQDNIKLRFGIDPYVRFKRYNGILSRDFKESEYKLLYWHYPIRLLKAQYTKNLMKY